MSSTISQAMTTDEAVAFLKRKRLEASQQGRKEPITYDRGAGSLTIAVSGTEDKESTISAVSALGGVCLQTSDADSVPVYNGDQFSNTLRSHHIGFAGWYASLIPPTGRSATAVMPGRGGGF